MATRRLQAIGAARPEVAWGRYLQIAAWPTWSPQILSVETEAARIALGVTGTVHALGGLRLPFTITAVNQQARSWSWLVRWGPVSMTLNHEVHPHARGCRTVLSMEGPGLVLLGYAPAAWLALQRLVAAG